MLFVARIFLVVLVCVLYEANATTFTKCAGGYPPLNLNVQGCNEPPCKFYEEQFAVMIMNFKVDHNVRKLKASVRTQDEGSGVYIPYPLPQPDACRTGLVGAKCPLVKGKQATYELKMPILKLLPKVKTLFEFYLKDEYDRVVVCFKLEAEIV